MAEGCGAKRKEQGGCDSLIDGVLCDVDEQKGQHAEASN